MMGKTHVAMGVAAATATMTFVPALSDAPLTAALIGGAAGGIISDIDIESNDYCKDALYARIIAGIIVGASFLVDGIMHLGVCDSIRDSAYSSAVIGIGIFGVVCLFGALLADHRTFTHSLLAMVIWSASLILFCRILIPFFAVGFISHIVLDLFNKQKVQILFPFGDGFCLGLFYAKGITNVLCLITGICLSVIFIAAHFNMIDLNSVYEQIVYLCKKALMK